ncbi:MAG: toll/interleukin-1 receptor domain-containing protein [Opitutales bacterium]
MPAKHYKYKAFISYSHMDEEWGTWLHEGLENFKIPWGLQQRETLDGSPPKKILLRRLYPIFRDREELPTSADLGEAINQAIKESSHMVVICSPRAAQSHWVNEEIMQFKRLGRSDYILCLIVDGRPNASYYPEWAHEECFPVAVKYEIASNGQLTDIPTHPIAADAREDRDGKPNALLKVVAGLLGVGFDDLKQRESTRLHRRVAWATSISLALVALVVGLSIWTLQLWTKVDQLEGELANTSETQSVLRKSAEKEALRAEVFADAAVLTHGLLRKRDRTNQQLEHYLEDVRAYVEWGRKWGHRGEEIPDDVVGFLLQERGELLKFQEQFEGPPETKEAIAKLAEELRTVIYLFETDESND